MQDKTDARSAGQASKVSRRFWTLLMLIVALALTSSAVALRMTTMPFLVAQQYDAIDGQARKDARSLAATLQQHRLLMRFIASANDVVNVALGFVENDDIVRDYLENLQRPDALSWVALYDVFGDQIARFDVAPDDVNVFSNGEVLSLVTRIAEEKPGAAQTVTFRWSKGRAHVIVAVPVINRGYVEGVVLGGFALDANEIFPANEIAKSTFIVESGSLAVMPSLAPAGSSVARLSNANLAVVLVPDIAAVQAANRRIITRAISAVATVLAIAFWIFALVGRSALVEPHLRLEEQKQELSELAAVAERAGDAIIVTDLDGRIVWTNPAFELLSGYTISEVRGRRPGSFLQGEGTDPEAVARLRESRLSRKPCKVEILNFTRDGRPYYVAISLSPLIDPQGDVYGFMATSHDVTEAREQREAILKAKHDIEHQALHEPLTGLPNRRALNIALEDRATDNAAHATIVRIDLDHFKYVNDTLGHNAGDFVLCEVARILREETKKDDLPVRVGGDEFVILMRGAGSSEAGRLLAERILDRIKAPMEFQGKTIRVGASFGVASTKDGLLPLDELIVGADSALYEAKDKGRNCVRLYSADLHKSVLNRRALARQIKPAITNDELVPYFHPQFCARTFQVIGAEVLCRWHSPTLGIVGPTEFLPIAQQLSLLEDVDTVVFNKAVKEIARLQEQGLSIPKISFNVTAERLQEPSTHEAIRQNLGLGPKLAFEVLESVLLEEQSDNFHYCVDLMREMGVSIEIDDFGSGHASIVGLMTLQPDVMKIDQQLVMPLVRSETNRNLLKQIIGMADVMGLQVTAEGVETMEHARILGDLGCDTLQGYAFAKPMPADALAEFIEAWDPSQQFDTMRKAG